MTEKQFYGHSCHFNLLPIGKRVISRTPELPPPRKAEVEAPHLRGPHLQPYRSFSPDVLQWVFTQSLTALFSKHPL